MNIPAVIAAIQKKLGIDVDGAAGPQTWRAIYSRICPNEPLPADDAPAPSGNFSGVDSKSEKVIGTLQPEVQPYARSLIAKSAAAGITIRVISGLRTYAEQNALYEQGRSKAGRVVTNARGGYSNHNFGIAFDVGVFDGSRYLEESPRYKAVGAIGLGLGLEWGGNWKTIQDEPHFQLRPRWASELSEKEMLAELRSRTDDHRAYYV